MAPCSDEKNSLINHTALCLLTWGQVAVEKSVKEGLVLRMGLRRWIVDFIDLHSGFLESLLALIISLVNIHND